METLETNENNDMQKLAEKARDVLQKLPMIGPIQWLYLHSATHKHLFVSDLEWRVLPPLVLEQCKLYMKGPAPVAYISWAKVSEEVEARMLANNGRIGPSEWRSGERLLVIDMLAPFGDVELMFERARRELFPTATVYRLMADSDTGETVLKSWPPLESVS